MDMKANTNLRRFSRTAATFAAVASSVVLINGSIAQTSESDRRKYPSLTIDGFNYTDVAIDYFSVDGSGGGLLLVSTETSGGGGGACCFRLYPLIALKSPIEVKWSRYINGKYRWCRKTVMMTGPIPDDPTDLGVHFMPDGNIVVQASHWFPDIKLALKRFNAAKRKESGNAIHDEEVATCSDTQ